MFSQTATDVLPQRDGGLEGWRLDKPSARIKPHRIMVDPTHVDSNPWTPTQMARLKVQCRYHYTTATIILESRVLFVPKVDKEICWNELPVELRDLTATLKTHLKTHLFRVVFFL